MLRTPTLFRRGGGKILFISVYCQLAANSREKHVNHRQNLLAVIVDGYVLLSVPRQGIIFTLVDTVFLVCSLKRVRLFYQLKFNCVKAQVIPDANHLLKLNFTSGYKDSNSWKFLTFSLILNFLFSLDLGLIFKVWAFYGVSIFICFTSVWAAHT